MRSSPGRSLCAGATSVLCAIAVGCNLGGDVHLDGGDDAGAESALEAGDAELDGDGAPRFGSGPVTLVFSELSASADRLCDLDGDGIEDNAIAELGDPHAAILEAAVSTVMQSAIERGTRYVLHIPFVSDLSLSGEVELEYYGLRALDTDHPEDPSDDFSGEEPFHVDADYLDDCGEPKHDPLPLVVVDGEVTDFEGAFSIPAGSSELVFERSVFSATVAPGAASARFEVCGYLSIAELGARCLVGSGCDPDEQNGLEFFVAGGAAVGAPGVPGVDPDVDVDGDGLERLELDAEGQVERCIDGDGTVVDGRACWQDARMADGFAIVLRADMVRAVLAGREPGWEHLVEAGLCPEGPPAESVLEFGEGEGGCVEADQQCDPRLAEPCCDTGLSCLGLRWRGYRCLGPCDLTRCDYGTRVGRCIAAEGGICEPIAQWPAESDCDLGEEGCATEYRVSEGTLCVSLGEANRCVETCEATPVDCGDSNHQCMPIAWSDDGFCAYLPEE